MMNQVKIITSKLAFLTDGFYLKSPNGYQVVVDSKGYLKLLPESSTPKAGDGVKFQVHMRRIFVLDGTYSGHQLGTSYVTGLAGVWKNGTDVDNLHVFMEKCGVPHKMKMWGLEMTHKDGFLSFSRWAGGSSTQELSVIPVSPIEDM